MIAGHQQLAADFRKLAESGNLSHAYIFSGEPEVGKFLFAKHLAYLLETGKFEISDRPLQDALVLENASGIDAMRDLKSFLWQKPNISAKRTAVINNADNLTDEAQNAILKITEEPPEKVLLILVVSQPDNLLPPLLSRLQKIHFGRLSDGEMAEFVSKSGFKNLKPADLFGRPGRAVKLASGGLYADAEKIAGQFSRSSGPVRSKLIKELVDLQKEKPEILDMFFESVILDLRKDPVRNAPILKDVLHRLFLIKSYNVNKRLQLEAI